MSLRVGIISLGCPRNLVDSETLLAGLKQKNIPTAIPAKADCVIVNTCAFIKEAKEESIRTILQLLDLKKQGLLKKIIVHGCLAARYKHRLAKHLAGVDAFVGRLSLDQQQSQIPVLTPKHYAYVKIAEGCGNRCSYCIIPSIKGALASRPLDSIIAQVRQLDKNNVKEIILIGQDISLYGRDAGAPYTLAGLLREILKNTSAVRWIRLLYLHPAHTSDELIALVAREKRICKYIDLPIQHINNRILSLMERKTTRRGIESLIKKIRKKIPNVFLRTSVIVGFPSETRAEFQELLDFIKETRFERLGAFVYSREEGTKAYRFKNQLHHKTKQARFDALMSLQRGIAASLNQALLGTTREVMIDAKEEDAQDTYLARLEQDAPEVDGTVYVRSKKKLKPGTFVHATIVDTMEYDLLAEAV